MWDETGRCHLPEKIKTTEDDVALFPVINANRKKENRMHALNESLTDSILKFVYREGLISITRKGSTENFERPQINQ